MKMFANILMVSLLGLGLAQAKSEVKKNSLMILKNVNGTVKWTGYGVGKSHTGVIMVKSGEVTLDGDAPTQAHFTLDMKSLDTKDSEKLKGHLKSPDFFDVEKYPETHFKSTTITPAQTLKAGNALYTVKGDLTIKDKTQPIEFMLEITKKDKTYTGKASMEITDRTKYGIVYNSKQFSPVSKLGDKLIEDNIKLEIDVTVR